MDIRKLIVKSAPPYEWLDNKNHPIHTLGHYVSGVYERFIFDKNAVDNADEEFLKKIYGEIARYWYNQNICVDKYGEYIDL